MRFLWVSNHTPFRVDFGGGQRSQLIFRALRSIADVDVLLITPNPPAPDAVAATYGISDGVIRIVQPTPRGSRFPWTVARPISPALIDRIAYNFGRRSIDYSANLSVASAVQSMCIEHNYDLFFGRHLKNSGQAGLLDYRKAVVDIDDNEIELYRLILADPATHWLRRLVLSRRIVTLQKLLPPLLHAGPFLWVSKEEDRTTPGFERADVLPNIPYALSQPVPPQPWPLSSDCKTILFVGMLSYIYNRQGIDWFLENVWPAVHSQVHGSRFRIVGSRLLSGDRARWATVSGVEVSGFVEDIATAYRDCSFMAVPIWSGGGTHIKVLEALMYGRTCVLAQPAYKGFGSHFPQETSVAVASNAAHMIKHCVSLLNNPTKCAEMGAEGSRRLGQYYSYSLFQRIVLTTVERALRMPGGKRPNTST